MPSLLDALRKKNVVSNEIIQDALRAGGEREAIGVLLQKGVVSADELAKIRSQQFGLPILDIAPDFKVLPEFLDIFSQELIKRLKILPVSKEGAKIKVGIVEPENIEVDSALDFISVIHNISIARYVISLDDFERTVKKLSELEIEVKEALEKLGEEKKEREIKERGEKKVISQAELQQLAETAPVTRIVDVILSYGIDSAASDIHIEPSQSGVRVRFRIDGKLKASLFLPKDVAPAVLSRLKILASLRVDETRIPQDGRIHYFFGTHEVDFRVSTFPTIEGEKAALRILDSQKGLLSLEELGLQPKSLESIRTFMKYPFGAMLISGPTGSGKTTTLYSVLKELNRDEVNIVTLEDPIEYYLPGINQSQIRPEIGYDFVSGLRQILRQDPNVVMVGEVRDNETARLLIQAALTGHLVLSTIHTNDAIGIIPRLLDMGVDNFLIPSSVRLVVAQRLVPKLCPDCKKPYNPPSHIQKIVERELSFLPEKVISDAVSSDQQEHGESMLEKIRTKEFSALKFFKSEGCQYCGGSGIKGRIAVYETFTVGPELEKIVIESPSESSLKKEAQRQGMLTMRQDGILKVLDGVVGIEGVLTNTAPSYT